MPGCYARTKNVTVADGTLRWSELEKAINKHFPNGDAYFEQELKDLIDNGAVVVIR